MHLMAVSCVLNKRVKNGSFSREDFGRSRQQLLLLASLESGSRAWLTLHVCRMPAPHIELMKRKDSPKSLLILTTLRAIACLMCDAMPDAAI